MYVALYILILPPAPSQPEALRVIFINATTVSVAWEPPLSPNGIILSYTVAVQNLITNEIMISVSPNTDETFEGLEPATTHLVTVQGVTSAGFGGIAGLIVTTPPCECHCMTCLLSASCSLIMIAFFCNF